MSNQDFLAKHGRDAFAKSSFWTGSTPGTGIASNSAPGSSVTATKGILCMYNSAVIGSGTQQGVYLVPEYIHLIATKAQTGANNFSLVGKIDNATRHASGGTDLIANAYGIDTIDTRSSWSKTTAKTEVDFGDLTLAAESAAMFAFQRLLKPSAVAIEDQFYIFFGDGPRFAPSGDNVYVHWVPRLRIGRACSLVLHDLCEGSPSADPEFEVNIGWTEHGHT